MYQYCLSFFFLRNNKILKNEYSWILNYNNIMSIDFQDIL